ncbi:unnamed protein product [Ilex paraguariensis]|uniref:Uncharacterized protein n=1 Tax=Ilex paraguariensis TaxID=185542 RepID=A0ABC8TVC9_9AQUA
MGINGLCPYLDLKKVMAILIATLVDGLGQCIEMLWRSRELRFAAIFEAVTSVARNFTMALMSCVLGMFLGRGQQDVAFL